jgi:hypothetical protein
VTAEIEELQRKRALIARLVHEEGCPAHPSDDDDGAVCCAFCGGREIPSNGEPRYDHNKRCVWLELVREAGPPAS